MKLSTRPTLPPPKLRQEVVGYLAELTPHDTNPAAGWDNAKWIAVRNEACHRDKDAAELLFHALLPRSVEELETIELISAALPFLRTVSNADSIIRETHYASRHAAAEICGLDPAKITICEASVDRARFSDTDSPFRFTMSYDEMLKAKRLKPLRSIKFAGSFLQLDAAFESLSCFVAQRSIGSFRK